MPKKQPIDPKKAARGRRLRLLRERLGLRQEDLSPGNHDQVANAEAGRNGLSGGKLLFRIAEHMGMRAEDLGAYLDEKLTIEQAAALSTPGLKERQPARW